MCGPPCCDNSPLPASCRQYTPRCQTTQYPQRQQGLFGLVLSSARSAHHPNLCLLFLRCFHAIRHQSRLVLFCTVHNMISRIRNAPKHQQSHKDGCYLHPGRLPCRMIRFFGNIQSLIPLLGISISKLCLKLLPASSTSTVFRLLIGKSPLQQN